MRLEVFVPQQDQASLSNYLMHISNKETGQRLFALSRDFDIEYVPGCEEYIAKVFFRLMTQSRRPQLRFQSGSRWFVLHHDGELEISDDVSEALVHVLLHAAFLIYDQRQLV